MTRAGMAMVAALGAERLRPGAGPVAAACALAANWWPGPTVFGAAVAILLWHARNLRSRRRQKAAAEQEVVLLGHLVTMGVRAGLAPAESLARARSVLTSGLIQEVDRVLRRATLIGPGPALAEATGYGAPLYRLMSRAVQTGAPLAEAVEAATSEMTRDRVAQRLEEARRLPVRLMVPLALGILPGFVLMVLGPVVNEAIAQFAI